MPLRGLRGATTVTANTTEALRAATRELLLALVAANALDPADIVSVIFTATPDVTAEAPARSARELGWTDAALLCVAEMPVDSALPLCIRVLIHWNTDKAVSELRHIYLHSAAQLRPDRTQS